MTPLARLTLLLSPCLAYPLGAAALFAVDTLAGERLVAYQLMHDQRLLLETFIADFIAALPAALILTALIVVGAWLLRRRGGHSAAVAFPLAGGAIAGVCAAVMVTGDWIGATHLALLAAGLVYALPISLALRHLLRASTEEAR